MRVCLLLPSERWELTPAQLAAWKRSMIIIWLYPELPKFGLRELRRARKSAHDLDCAWHHRSLYLLQDLAKSRKRSRRMIVFLASLIFGQPQLFFPQVLEYEGKYHYYP